MTLRLRLAMIAVYVAYAFEPRHPHRKEYLDLLRNDLRKARSGE